MMKKLACALAVVALSMTGCSGSLCDESADTFHSLNEKLSGCPDFNGIKFPEPTDTEIKQCEDNLDKCSDADKKALNQFIDCVNKVDKCTPSTQQAFAASLEACSAPLNNVSDQCGASGASVPAKALAFIKAHKAQ